MRAVRRNSERIFGLFEHELDPAADLARLQAECVGKVRDGHLAVDVAANDLGFLLRREVTTILADGTFLRWDKH